MASNPKTPENTDGLSIPRPKLKFASGHRLIDLKKNDNSITAVLAKEIIEVQSIGIRWN